MARLKQEDIQNSLSVMLDFLVPYLPLANSHANNFITNNYWDTLLTEEMQKELLLLTDDELAALPFSAAAHESGNKNSELSVQSLSLACENMNISQTNAVLPENICRGRDQNECSSHLQYSSSINCFNEKREDTQNNLSKRSSDGLESQQHISSSSRYEYQPAKNCVRKFCQDAWRCTLEGLGLSMLPWQLLSVLGVTKEQDTSDVFVGTFMNQKKQHEVEEMSKFCTILSKTTGTDLIIDVGSGKGYLGNHLYLQYGQYVLGVDAVTTNTESAGRRMNILEKQWTGLTRNASQQQKLTKKEKKKLKETLKSRAENTDMTKHEIDTQDAPFNLKSTKCLKCDLELRSCVCNRNISCQSNHVDVKFKKTSSNETGKLPPRYVPLTMYIDKSTDFHTLSKTHFPDLFTNFSLSHLQNDTLLHNSSSPPVSFKCSNACQLQNDSVENDCEQIEFKCRDVADSGTSATVLQNEGGSRTSLNLLLTGLHTCGDLASNSLELFVSSPMMKTVCNVGCCYHLLTEEFLEQTAGGHTGSYGFPKSQFLRQQNLSLGTSARNLACQAVHRMSQTQALQGERFYPRALLEQLVSEVCKQEPVVWRGLRNLEQKTNSTQDFLRQACQKLGISQKVSDDKIEEYVVKYAAERRHLAAFVQLKAVLAPVIETVILLDRALFLLEQETVQCVYLVQMFDPVISPRCYGIVALK